MIAGTETTATLLSGLVYLLLRNPGPMRQLTDEIRESFNSPEEMTLGSLARLKYLHACLEEALRLYPPIPTGLQRRTPPGGTAICGKYVPENTIVQISRLVAARSPTNFRNPDSFIPERWISSEYDSDNKAATQPFSLGPRNCIGKNLANHEIRLILAMVIYHFDLKLCEESKTWIDHKVFMFWEKPPLMVTLTPRLG